MHNYRIPHKGLEVVYCRKVPTPIECQMIDYNSHKTHRYFENNQDDATLHHMGTSIPISMQSLLSAYQKDHKEKKVSVNILCIVCILNYKSLHACLH